MQPGCPSIVPSGPLKVTQELEGTWCRALRHVFPVQGGKQGSEMDKNQKGAQRSSPPRDSQGNQAPCGPLEEQAALPSTTKKGSTTQNQVRNSPPQMVLASKAGGERIRAHKPRGDGRESMPEEGKGDVTITTTSLNKQINSG